MTNGPQPDADAKVGELTAELYDVVVHYVDGNHSTMPRTARANVATVIAWFADRDAKPLSVVDPESRLVTVMAREHVTTVLAIPVRPADRS